MYVYTTHVNIVNTSFSQNVPTSHSSLYSFLPHIYSPAPGNHCCDFYHHRFLLAILELHINGITYYILFWKATMLTTIPSTPLYTLLYLVSFSQHNT